MTEPVTHKLVDDTLVVRKGGVWAICTCGWESGCRFSRLVASALFQEHLKDVGVKDAND